MKHYNIKIVYLCLGMVLFVFSGFSFASGPGVEKNKTIAAPSLLLPEPDFVFSKVIEGTEILHTFIVKNKGTAVLEIQKVKTG